MDLKTITATEAATSFEPRESLFKSMAKLSAKGQAEEAGMVGELKLTQILIILALETENSQAMSQVTPLGSFC